MPWLLNPQNGLVLCATPQLTKRRDLEPYTPTQEEIMAGHKIDKAVSAVPAAQDVAVAAPVSPRPEGETLAADRDAKLAEAISGIDPKYYAKAAFGRPAMPKVSAVEALTGYTDVTVEEILAIMEKQGLLPVKVEE